MPKPGEANQPMTESKSKSTNPSQALNDESATSLNTAELILVVEDEADLVSVLTYNLEREGYQTRVALNGAEALKQVALEPQPNLILLDLMLPDMPGTDICRFLKQDQATQQIPVIMVTAKGEEIDRVVGFELGADDYVVKPYSVRELMLRIRSVLKRYKVNSPTEEPLNHGILRMDVNGHRVWIKETEALLTALEFKLLYTLMTRRGRVQTRETLLTDVWDMNSDLTTRTVDTHVKRLRQKLGPAGPLIETIRGVGYRLSDEVKDL